MREAKTSSMPEPLFLKITSSKRKIERNEKKTCCSSLFCSIIRARITLSGAWNAKRLEFLLLLLVKNCVRRIHILFDNACTFDRF